MPEIPSNFVQSVMPGGQIEPQRIQASPADFGAQVGATLQQTSAEEMQAALKRQALINQSRAEETFTTQYMPAASELTNQFYQLRGQAAQDALPEYTQKIIDLQKSYASKMESPIAAQQFNTLSRSRMAYDMDRMSRTAAVQSDQWQVHQNDSTLNSFIMAGMQNPTPENIDSNLGQIIHQAHYFGALRNIDDATTDLRVATAANKMVYGAVATKAETGDVAGAQALMDRYQQYLTNPNSVRALQGMLAKGQTQAKQKVEDYAYNYTYGMFNMGDPTGDIGKATSWITNPQNFQPLGLDADGAAKVAGQLQAQWNRSGK